MLAENTRATARSVPLKLVHNRRHGGNADDLVFTLLISAAGLLVQFIFLASGHSGLLAGI